jgi:hypothetical protein
MLLTLFSRGRRFTVFFLQKNSEILKIHIEPNSKNYIAHIENELLERIDASQKFKGELA